MRKLTTLAATTAACALAAAAASAAAPPPQVRLDSGVIQGAVEDGTLAFKGVPFAAPPVGGLRWRAPQPVKPWTGVRQAVEYGHDCMQSPFPSDAAPLNAPLSEDCLVLNVWRPAAPGGKLPVMVWIHGGGFVNGGVSPAVFSGVPFAKRGVVLVSINYRLGRFGFFGFPALTREHPGEPKGDYGYMDQIAALKWVQRNIAGFGGDPHNVTIFGESAGGHSVLALLASPLARGLFQKAIVQSGDGRPPPMNDLSRNRPGLPSAETLGVNFARAHGIEGTDAAALARLRALPAEDLAKGLNMVGVMRAANTYSGPMIDGRIVVEPLEATYRSGRFARVPIIVGATSADEGFASGATKEALFASFGPARAQAAAAFDPDGSATSSALRQEIGRDRVMVEPARLTAATFAARGLAAYEYRFSYVAQSMSSKWKSGAPHASDVPYVFDTVAARYGAELTPQDAAVAKGMQAYWVNFARTGDPNGAGLPPWPRYAADTDRLLEFRSDGTFAAGTDPLKTKLDAIAAAAPP